MHFKRFRFSTIVLTCAAVLHPGGFEVRAQTASASAARPDATSLARYDRNRDGQLDRAEVDAMEADLRRATTPSAEGNGADLPRESAIMLSPFEVDGSAQRGYYASNTMSGTRFNSKIEDLASSITVVTKEQMADFGLLDLNDVFLYEAGTEGTGNFTDFTVDARGYTIENSQFDPNNANRIRGVGSANISFGNFETSGRVPLDPINIDAVEISRGPNSNVFGLGDPAGTVNSVPASGNLSRNRSTLATRVDSFDGWRTSLDLNRVLSPGVLAIRGSVVLQHDGFARKPSGTDSRRLNGMVRFSPFKRTSLRASYSVYQIEGNRPNTVTPKDTIGYWRSLGSPTWDPLTQQVHLDGATVGTFSGTALPAYFTNGFTTRPSLFIDRNGLGYWSTNRVGSTNNPISQTSPIRFVTTNFAPGRADQPLFLTGESVSDKSIYDWSRINLSAVNRIDEKTETMTVSGDHTVFNTGRHMLAAQGSWFREDSERNQRNVLGRPPNPAITVGYLHIDVNERMLDGSANPYFLRPYIATAEPLSFSTPLKRDTFRAQLAYRLDLTKEKSAWRRLGRHQLSGYGEHKNYVQRQYSYRDAIASSHSWLPFGSRNGNNSTQPGPTVARGYFRYYLGDNQGSNVDYEPTDFTPGVYTFNWFNGAAGQSAWVREPVRLDRVASLDNAAGSLNQRNIVKTRGAVAQSHWLRSRVVTTFGVREDRTYNRRGVTGVLLPDGLSYDFPGTNAWAAGDWLTRSGRTKTAGVVVKPFPWLSVHANKSDSFRPEIAGQTIHLEPVPNPTGKGEDYGFTLNLLDGKLVVRANQYRTLRIGARDNTGTNLTRNARNIDFGSNNFSLDEKVREWVTARAVAEGRTPGAAEIAGEIARVTQLPEDIEARWNAVRVVDIDNFTAKGKEIEVNYNPTNAWTAKLNVAEQEAIDSNISANLPRWLAERLPVWRSIIDPITGRPWFSERYGNSEAADAYLARVVLEPLKLLQASEGKSRSQVRKYRANLSTNFRLHGLTDHRILKRFNLGGALRWESKGSIGYYGVQQPPALVTQLDVNRPIWDTAHLYADAFVGYRTRLFANRVGATFQLNVRNLHEDGRLQPVAAYPDGRPYSFRIIDPRLFILSASFEL